jgi:hypothetical protein
MERVAFLPRSVICQNELRAAPYGQFHIQEAEDKVMWFAAHLLLGAGLGIY